MDLITKTLFLCLALALASGAPATLEDPAVDEAMPDRCEDVDFDAIAPDDSGAVYFFKGNYLWKGFHGNPQLSSSVFPGLNGHIDAALRMHNKNNEEVHDRIFIYQDDKVLSYHNHTLEEGYPKTIQEEFPGIPSNLCAAAECPAGVCTTDAIIFFKNHDVYFYDVATKAVKTKTWPSLPKCTSAFYWLEHFYCFHGHNFTRFNPVTGLVEGDYPKDARNYFMRCPGFGHGGNYSVPKCSEVKLDAITVDDAGKMYFFRGPIYMRLDTIRDGLHSFPISRSWKEVANGVDAVFSYTDKLYMIKDDLVFIYKRAAHYTLIEGYPKSLKEELGIEGHVDAAFVCPNDHMVYVIQGGKMLEIDLTASPREVKKRIPLHFPELDAGMCGSDGVKVFKGSQYYQYESPKLFATSRIAARPLAITPAMMGCVE